MGEIILGLSEEEMGGHPDKHKGEPITVGEAINNFSGSLKVGSIFDLEKVFGENKDQEEVRLSIPMLFPDEKTQREFFKALRISIVNFLGVNGRNNVVEQDIEMIIGEAISDLKKHGHETMGLNEIFVLVKKQGNSGIIFKSFNPNEHADSTEVSREDSHITSDVIEGGNGGRMADGLEVDLEEKYGVDVSDVYHVVRDNSQRVLGRERDIKIESNSRNQ